MSSILKPAVFTGEKTVYAPRLGATIKRRPKSVTFTIPGGPRAAAALLEAAALAEQGATVNLRVMDQGATSGRLVVTTPEVEA